MKLRRRLRKVLLVLAGLVVLWLIYYAAISVVYGYKLRSLRAQVEAEGSSLDLAKLASNRTPARLEDKDNAAFLYRAAGLIMDMRTGPDIPDVDAFAAFEMAKPGERAKVVSEKRRGLETWLRDSALELQLLHQAALHEHAWFDLNYSEGVNVQIPHLAKLRAGARLLMLEAWLAAEKGDGHKALQATWTALRVRRAVQDEPMIISQMVGISTDSIAISALQGIMPLIQPPEADLRRIVAELQSRTAKSFRRGAEGERALVSWTFASARKNGLAYIFHEEGFSLPPTIHPSLKLALVPILNGLRPDEAYALACMNRFVDAASRLDSLSEAEVVGWLWAEDPTEAHRAIESIWSAPFRMVSGEFLPNIGSYLLEAKEQLARYAVAQCGIAAELYRLDHGVYPPNLEALVPNYLAKLPQDTFSGKPLLFKALPNGVLISSVGPVIRRPGDSESVPPVPPIEWRVERPTAPAKNS